ncbi:unannotated protein [freshwater metagenome]|uniref:Unannotated protein n=1 Tax=freshwater metagenome TaxID=449393 RepID=A0A6J5ZIX8_9ZZZZ
MTPVSCTSVAVKVKLPGKPVIFRLLNTATPEFSVTLVVPVSVPALAVNST